jgi:hypothetical protein
MELVPIEKKIKFRNKYWHLKLYGNGYIQVFSYNEEETIDEKIVYADWDYNIQGKTLLEKCKNAITKVEHMNSPFTEYKEVALWDGDMDKEMSIK